MEAAKERGVPPPKHPPLKTLRERWQDEVLHDAAAFDMPEDSMLQEAWYEEQLNRYRYFQQQHMHQAATTQKPQQDQPGQLGSSNQCPSATKAPPPLIYHKEYPQSPPLANSGLQATPPQ